MCTNVEFYLQDLYNFLNKNQENEKIYTNKYDFIVQKAVHSLWTSHFLDNASRMKNYTKQKHAMEEIKMQKLNETQYKKSQLN